MAFFITFAPMKETALSQVHRELQARMITFAGYQMPMVYSGVADEHQAVRNSVGVFDVSHMGEIWIKGPEAPGFLQGITSNDISTMYPGRVQYTCFPNGNGGIVDDLLIYMYDEEKFLLVVNASNIDKDWEWLKQQNGTSTMLENSSDGISQLAIQGPEAINVLQKLCSVDLAGMKYYTFEVGKVAGAEEVIISKTGYTGAGGFELYFYNREATKLWDAVMEAGREYSIKPAGLAARDTLRLEMGFCLYGNDIDETTSPIEAGLGWITKLTEQNQFIDRELLEKQKKEGVSRKLVAFTMLEKGIPRKDYEILARDGSLIGKVTSGGLSPMMNIGIGMGYLETTHTEPGTEIIIQIRHKQIAAVVVKPPIYQKA